MPGKLAAELLDAYNNEVHLHVHVLTGESYIDVLIRDKKDRERSKQGQTNNKAKQHSTPKAVTFPKKNELPRVGGTPVVRYI